MNYENVLNYFTNALDFLNLDHSLEEGTLPNLINNTKNGKEDYVLLEIT